MANPEMTPPEETLGEHWLQLLGMEHLKGTIIPGYTNAAGEPMRAEEFHQLCEADARPYFEAYEGLATDNPKREAYLELLQGKFAGFFPETSDRPPEA